MIHPTAIVDPGARLGTGVSIGPFSVVEANTDLGDGCVLGPHVTVLPHTTLGAGCKVHAGAVLGDLPQDTSFEGQESFVRIGSGCTIREGVTIHRGTKPGTTTEIGNDCFFMAFSHFAHNVKTGNGVIVANGALLAGYVEVGDRAFISGNSVVHQFTRIGRLAMLGGLAGVSMDVPPFCTVRPMTPNRVLGLNTVGMRRAGLGPEQRQEVKRAFDMLYRSGLNTGDAVRKMKDAYPAGPAAEFWQFVEQSKRGICALASGSPGDEAAA